MTLAEISDAKLVERWCGLSSQAQEAIGTKVLQCFFAELVADDDGTETTEADRVAARKISDIAFDQIDDVIEAAFPDISWEYPPGGIHYELRDYSGKVLGRITCDGVYRFVPTQSWRTRGRAVSAGGMPFDCVPAWARRAVSDGGWWGPVLRNATPATVKSDNQVRNAA